MPSRDIANPLSQLSEQDLVARAQQGDKQAIELLFHKHLPTVYRFSMRMCRDQEHARDIAQDSLTTALHSLSSFRGEASFGTWLFTIARSHCGRLRRHTSRETTSETGDLQLDDAPSWSPAPDQVVADNQMSSIVERALDSLDPAYREVILLRDVEGLSNQEVAQVLQLSLNAVKSRVHRARASLRDAVFARLREPAVASSVSSASSASNSACATVVETYSRTLEGDLSCDDCARFRKHIERCPHCASQMDSVKSILHACASLGSAPCEEPIDQMLHTTVDTWLKT